MVVEREGGKRQNKREGKERKWQRIDGRMNINFNKQQSGKERRGINRDNKRQKGRRGIRGNCWEWVRKTEMESSSSWDLAAGDLKAVQLTPGEYYSCPGWKISSCPPDQTAARPVGRKSWVSIPALFQTSQITIHICDLHPWCCDSEDTEVLFLHSPD